MGRVYVGMQCSKHQLSWPPVQLFPYQSLGSVPQFLMLLKIRYWSGKKIVACWLCWLLSSYKSRLISPGPKFALAFKLVNLLCACLFLCREGATNPLFGAGDNFLRSRGFFTPTLMYETDMTSVVKNNLWKIPLSDIANFWRFFGHNARVLQYFAKPIFARSSVRKGASFDV